MEPSTITIFTHDSIGVGEDAPRTSRSSSQPSLRAMPAMVDLRPGDANEVAGVLAACPRSCGTTQ